MLDVLSIKKFNIPVVVFKIITLNLLVIRHCLVNSICTAKSKAITAQLIGFVFAHACCSFFFHAAAHILDIV